MRLTPLLCALAIVAVAGPAAAAQKSVTLYLDGARVEQEARAVDGYLELPLPDAAIPGSLRVKPVGRGDVIRVEVVPAEQGRRKAREIARLEERKSELQDKLQALSLREEIFSSAVKLQSGKAPRKSKTNPDPLISLQQGTDFALSQLDAVIRDQRSCRLNLDAVDRKLAAAKKGSAVARIWLSGRRAKVSYDTGEVRWTPCYDLRWGGSADGELLLHARLPGREKGVLYQVSQGTVAEGVIPRPVRGDFPVLAKYPLLLQSGGQTGQPPRSFSFRAVEAALPPGDAAAFWRGEYLGSGRFSGGGATRFSIEPAGSPGPK
ncbi:MAG TPA: DUF4140 domain-containing protein [Candidatus Sulfotelmatobacter sp.]|nr:DUF4140 domain-containing protein [Candidatus Sulfotelmatobacter sp.]